jgi:hypothetical protein
MLVLQVLSDARCSIEREARRAKMQCERRKVDD